MKYLMAVLIVLLPSIGFSQTVDSCKTIEDDNLRLACYDLALGVTTTSVESDTSNNYTWRRQVEISELTDEKNVFLSVLSEDEVRDKYGLGSAPAVLNLRCMENTTAIIISFNDHFMSDHAGGGKVQYRLDDTPLATQSFRESNNNKALGLWSGGRSIPFIKKMFGHQQLIVRATPYNESSITVKFPIKGIEGAITDLREACGW